MKTIRNFFFKLINCSHKQISKPLDNHVTCINCGLSCKVDKENFRKVGNWHARKIA